MPNIRKNLSYIIPTDEEMEEQRQREEEIYQMRKIRCMNDEKYYLYQAQQIQRLENEIQYIEYE